MNIWYANPGRADKNIGKAYNEFCALVPDKDWIVISDQDALWWPELVLQQVADIVNGDGANYALLGASTNRLASDYQRPFPEDFNNMDPFHHRRVAEHLAEMNYGKIKNDRNRPVAGVFMLFPKQTWKRFPFPENRIDADTLFCKRIRANGGKIGVMEGVYVFHWYRANSSNPTKYKKHLLKL